MNASRPNPVPVGGRYARYLLCVLVIVYVFNFLDRQILAILAERIKADLNLADADLGFLYGTAFAIFYAIFGIPLGRLADMWDRRKLIAIGLAVWSLMTALSGLSRSFGELAAARIGVGIGEASATPAAASLLSDSFPAARRATVLAIYSSGIYIGAGLGVGIGGLIVERWDAAWTATVPPFGLRGWQVAFFAVGVPGLLLALWVSTLREPLRGLADGIAAEPEPHPFRELFRELRAVIPPLTLLHLLAVGAPPRTLAVNAIAGLAITASAWLLISITHTPSQWIALGLGVYSVLSWAQALGIRDRVAFALIFRTPSLRHTALAFSFLAFLGYSLGFWTPTFFVRMHAVSEREAGLVLGLTSAVAGWIGITVGGVAADRWRRSAACGRLYIGMLTAVAPVPLAVWMLTTENTTLAYVLNFPLALLSSMWIGPGISTVQDLVLPRLRATAAAAYLVVVTFIGLALGPYLVGFLSASLGDLRRAMLCALFASALVLGFAILAARRLAPDEASLRARARAAGEAGLD